MSKLQSSQEIDAAGAAALKVMRQRKMDRIQRIAYGIGFPIVLLILWEILCQIRVIDIRFFPSPSRIFTTSIAIASSPNEGARLARPNFLFATSTMFLIFAVVQFASVSIAGFMTMERLLYGIGGGAVALLTMPIGNKIGANLRVEVFDKLILFVLVILSARLLYSALA